MIARRHMLIVGLSVGAAALAEGLRPRKRLILLKGGTIEQALPVHVGEWHSQTASGLVTPDLAGKLAASLYSEIVARTYMNDRTGAMIMILAAYGDTQSDLLQLHRPEACYAAVGFDIESSQPVSLPLAPGVILPARRVVAETPERRENIVYWARLGEEVPQSASEQRAARFSNAVHGYLADGILVRCSMVGESAPSFAVLDDFVVAMMETVGKPFRPALVGTRIADAIAA